MEYYKTAGLFMLFFYNSLTMPLFATTHKNAIDDRLHDVDTWERKLKQTMLDLESGEASSALRLPDWIVYLRATSPTITIVYQDGKYFATPSCDSPFLHEVFPGDHNLVFAFDQLSGYDSHGHLFQAIGTERTTCNFDHCERIFNRGN